jgi:hypothetical protein
MEYTFMDGTCWGCMKFFASKKNNGLIVEEGAV